MRGSIYMLEGLQQYLMTVVSAVNSFLWDWALLILLLGTGVYFTIRLRFIQVRKFGAAFRLMFRGFSLRGEKAGASGMSSFQSLATAIAAQVGTGNIAGAATAMIAGGPGAIFGCGSAHFSAWQRFLPRQRLQNGIKPSAAGARSAVRFIIYGRRSRAALARSLPRASLYF